MKEAIKDAKIVGGYTLENASKVTRALQVVSDAKGGYDDSALLAEYDKTGGYITKNGDKVKMGSFYDFANKKARVEPKVIFIFNVNGQFVDVPAGEEMPGDVKATRILKAKVEQLEEEEVEVKPKKGKK